MPRYFFNLRYGAGADKVALDPEGNDLPDAPAAHRHALQEARGLIAGPPSFVVRDWFACSFEVEDDDGQAILTVPFSELVPEEDDEAQAG